MSFAKERWSKISNSENNVCCSSNLWGSWFESLQILSSKPSIMRHPLDLKAETCGSWFKRLQILSSRRSIMRHPLDLKAETWGSSFKSLQIYHSDALLCDTRSIWGQKHWMLSQKFPNLIIWTPAHSELSKSESDSLWRHTSSSTRLPCVRSSTRLPFSKPLFWLLHPSPLFDIPVAVWKRVLWDSTPNIRRQNQLFSGHAAVPRKSGPTVNWSEPYVFPK